MKNALLIDDDYVTNLINRKALQRTGLFDQINEVLNGKEALSFLQEHESDPKSLPDIILLDLNMPVMGGFAFLEEFNKLNFVNKDKVKIIILSSSDNADDIGKAKQMGVQSYLTKPIAEKTLVKAID